MKTREVAVFIVAVVIAVVIAVLLLKHTSKREDRVRSQFPPLVTSQQVMMPEDLERSN